MSIDHRLCCAYFLLQTFILASLPIRRFRYLKLSTGFREHWQYNNHIPRMFSEWYCEADIVLGSEQRGWKQYVQLPLRSAMLDDLPVSSGSGGIISNANDMVIWLQTLLNEGRHPGTNETVFSAEAINKVAAGITVSTPVAPFPELSPKVY
ncbi:hypothetical protein B0H14DRAFT_3123597 [Mycena olivaceomarginata]|nr:hypothetical protein B0H14DRAFT_3123597 [Mycena olivaceomarginata]